MIFKHEARHRNGGVAVVNLVWDHRHERQRTLVDGNIMRATSQRVVNGKPSPVCQRECADRTQNLRLRGRSDQRYMGILDCTDTCQAKSFLSNALAQREDIGINLGRSVIDTAAC